MRHLKQNYSVITEAELKKIKESKQKPTLLLQVCCAPCSSYVLEYLSQYFSITLYYYNPNISPESEYLYRLEELKRLISEMPCAKETTILDSEYDHQAFLEIAKGLEHLPEGDERCKKCYRLRLNKTAQAAKENGFDYFTTSLSISPYKNADWLNEIGQELSKEYGVRYLISDFKKKNGYKRSIELSAEYRLYRQDYCGCAYSKAQAQIRMLEKNGKQ